MSAAVILEPATFAAELKAMIEATVQKEVSKIPGMVIEKPMTLKEAAAFLKISTKTMYKYMGEGIIKPHRLNKNPMFFASDLNAQIRAKKS